MLRLEIYQETAHFRIATIGNPYLSYLLPPPSTIYGFLRKMTNYESINYTNTKLSIQGRYEAVSLEKERLVLETKKEIKTNIIPIQKLHNAKWIIHINSSQDFENKIKNAFGSFSGVLRLGRTEDLIIDYAIIEIKEKTIENNINIKEDYFIYRKWEKGKDFKGQLFSMFLDSEVDENKKIIGYKPIQLIYSSVGNVKNEIKTCDGGYLVSWIS
ncbi:MAG TPA: CRISPR-associated protein Cas5 [Spirochaetales bacterium]|nr:CRISPR-associated protein Cas5 [Spirochaetales bacterium]